MKSALLIFLLATTVYGEQIGKQLKILTWNVFLLPGYAANTYQAERIPLIADFIIEGDYDIVALQEVFTGAYYKKLKSHLAKDFPYDTGEPFRSWFKPVNSGLVIFSKYPVNNEMLYLFSGMRHADMFSSKGIMEVSVDVGGREVRVINTHFQAREEYAYIRKGQLRLLKERVLPSELKELPTILAGDFNINQKSPEYLLLEKAAGVKPMQVLGPLLFTADDELNTLRDGKDKTLIDYIFVKGLKLSQNQRILDPRGVYDGQEEGSLSDHQPVEALVEIQE